jgi:hypothetical protein
MRPLIKGLVVAALHVALVASLGAKMLYDRATLPRVWVRTAPYDPSLPIRGRYVRLQLVVEARGIQEPLGPPERWSKSYPAAVRVEGERLVAEPAPRETADFHVRFVWLNGEWLAVLDPTVAFFIPEHIPDPSWRKAGEALWVEVTLPRHGPPRPIRLGVKKGDAPLVPLDIR